MWGQLWQESHPEDEDEGQGAAPSRRCSQAQSQPLRSTTTRLLQSTMAGGRITPREEVERFIVGKRGAKTGTYPQFWLSKCISM